MGRRRVHRSAYPHEYDGNTGNGRAFQDEFNQAVNDSVQREELDAELAEDGRLYLTGGMARRSESFWRVMDNRSVTDQPLTIGGVVYERGWVCTRIPRLSSRSTGRMRASTPCPVRTTPTTGRLGMQVKVDGEIRYDSGLVNSRQEVERRAIEIDVTDAQVLTLIVTTGDENNGGDHANWADACLVPAE